MTNLKLGKYWTVDCIAVRAIFQDIPIRTPHAPAVLMPVYDDQQTFLFYRFLEIVPNSERIENTFDINSWTTIQTTTVEINVYEGNAIEQLTLIQSTRCPFSWFGLDAVPTNHNGAISAYDRAMSIIG